MEKVLTDSERIRRAEEIYARRRGLDLSDKSEKEKGAGIYKFLFKFLLLINIVILVLCIENKESVFNESFLNQFSSYSVAINQKINGLINALKEEEEDGSKIDKSENINNTENSIDNIQEKDEVQINENQNNETEKTSIESFETIEDTIKNSYSFIKPVEGTVTSFFGDRESKYQNVSGYHTGIDIGSEKGTIIKAAMEGKVTQVSNVGDYRKTFKNRK